MNTKIGRIARRQSRLGNFVLSPSPDPSMESSDSGDDSSGFAHDDEMTVSQCFTLLSYDKKGK